MGLLIAGWLLLEPVSQTVQASQSPDASIEGKGSGQTVFSRLSEGKVVKPDRSYKEPQEPTVYLTFDDGPSKHTGQVLDILRQEQVKATFFVLGELVPARKELVVRMREEGHSIGNHSYNHVYKELYSDFGSFWKQAVKTDGILEEVLGYKPYLLRAPGGTHTNFDAFYYYYLEAAGYRIVDWNVDSRDAIRQGVKAAEIVAEVRQSVLKHELVVLMHDGAGHEETVKALPEIIAYYRGLGYRFAALDEFVAPVQFPLGKSKWRRSYTQDGFKQMAAAAEAAGLERGGQGAEQAGALRLAAEGITAQEAAALAPQEASSDQGGAAPPLPQPPLLVTVGDSPVWKLEAERYSYEYGRFAVPLRGLAERLGGRVEWDDVRQLATVTIGTRKLEFDPVRKVIRDSTPGQSSAVHYLADIDWIDGELRIPLRAGTQLLGGSVASYALGETEHRVTLSERREWRAGLPLQPIEAWKRIESRKLHV
jgi:peptidoglycan/xylan/chitin deacetylase (PgdA/CDA1 family)